MNPIIDAVAEHAATTDYAISGITVCAPLAVGTAVLAINWARFEDEGTGDIDAPNGISVTVKSRVPETVIPLPAMTDTAGMALAAAWTHGAWDIKVTTVEAGYAGSLPPYAATLDAAIRRQGFAAWHWRPMLRGPEIRAKANAGKDMTLNPWSLGRDGPAPEIRMPVLKPNREHVVRLGRDGAITQQERPARRATVNQRGYLGRLLRAAGEDDTLPANLTLREASDWIDRLAPNRQRQQPATLNQIRLINNYTLRLGEPGISGWGLSYDDAQRRIEELRRRL